MYVQQDAVMVRRVLNVNIILNSHKWQTDKLFLRIIITSDICLLISLTCVQLLARLSFI